WLEKPLAIGRRYGPCNSHRPPGGGLRICQFVAAKTAMLGQGIKRKTRLCGGLSAQISTMDEYVP
ncbi:hypothetical protein, partial [Mesorhizobium sp. M7A.F.Ca.CA.004.05.2.1]|uniref:hypothetical protein n=1 Tax=Mesorhizobium sp. M7A.F.Ca.CA.004.05.2.1 TaxID=2496716 RepID=UPI0019D0BE5E